jgi:hypothetical protein
LLPGAPPTFAAHNTLKTDTQPVSPPALKASLFTGPHPLHVSRVQTPVRCLSLFGLAGHAHRDIGRHGPPGLASTSTVAAAVQRSVVRTRHGMPRAGCRPVSPTWRPPRARLRCPLLRGSSRPCRDQKRPGSWGLVRYVSRAGGGGVKAGQ